MKILQYPPPPLHPLLADRNRGRGRPDSNNRKNSDKGVYCCFFCNYIIFVTRHAKRYELGGRRHFEKIRLKVNVASRKNSTPKRLSKRSLTYYKTGSKAFFMLRFSATRLSNILYDIKCSLLNVRKLKLGRESSTQFRL